MKYIITLSLVLLVAGPAFAHCDWIKGPVVLDAQAALDKGDVAPVLKWIPATHEQEVRDAFAQTMLVRKQSAQARELADRWFFETVVRIHREVEGAPFHGLRGEEYTPDPGIVAADHALESGSLAELEKTLNADVAAGLRERFQHAVHMKALAGENANAGRQYVREYTEFVHYVERLHLDATSAAHGEHAAKHED